VASTVISFAEISDYTGNRREMEDNKSVAVGSPVAQNEPPVPIGSHTQPSEPIGDKKQDNYHGH
jgi:hypothetical protein